MSEHVPHFQETRHRSKVMEVGGKALHFLFPKIHDHQVSRAETIANPWSPETTKIRLRREKMLVTLAERPDAGVISVDDLIYYDTKEIDEAQSQV